MTDRTFVYWTADGERCEVPIIPFQVPPGAALGPGHSCLSDRQMMTMPFEELDDDEIDDPDEWRDYADE